MGGQTVSQGDANCMKRAILVQPYVHAGTIKRDFSLGSQTVN